MLKRKDLVYLAEKWTKYKESTTDPNVREAVSLFITDLEDLLKWDDWEEQEAFDKMLESMSPEEYKRFCEEYEADEALMAELEL